MLNVVENARIQRWLRKTTAGQVFTRLNSIEKYEKLGEYVPSNLMILVKGFKWLLPITGQWKSPIFFFFCHYLSMSRWVICVSVAIVGHGSPSNSLFKHSDFFQVNASSPMGHLAKSIDGDTRGKNLGQAMLTSWQTAHLLHRYNSWRFLTATTLIYTFGAGITSAASTRL